MFPELNRKGDAISYAVPNDVSLDTGSKPPTAGSWASLFPKAAAPVALPEIQLPVDGPECEQLGGKHLFHVLFFLDHFHDQII